MKYPFHTDVLVISFLFVLFSAKLFMLVPDFSKYNRKTRKVIEIKKKKSGSISSILHEDLKSNSFCVPLLYWKTSGRELWRYIIQEKSLEWLVWKHIEPRVKGEINSIRNMQDDCTARSQCILGNGFTHSVQSLGQTHPVSDWISTLKNKQYNHRKVGCPPAWWQRMPIAAPAKWKSAQISLGVYDNCNSFGFFFTNQTLNVKWK